MVAFDWRIALTFSVAALLSWLTVLLLRLNGTAPRATKVATLRLFIPATFWAWESTLREMLRPLLPSVPWDVLDVIAGAIALLGLLAFFRWVYCGGDDEPNRCP